MFASVSIIRIRFGRPTHLLSLVVAGVVSARALASPTDPLLTASFLSFDTGNAPHSVAISDFNRDGKPDLAVANYHANTVSVLLGNGNGSFAGKTDYGTGAQPNSIAIGDFNADGKADLVLADSHSPGEISVLRGNGDGTFAASSDFGVSAVPVYVTVGDL